MIFQHGVESNRFSGLDMDETQEANSTAVHFNLIRQSDAYQAVEREAEKDLEALEDVESTPAYIFDKRLTMEKRIKILGELLQSTLLAAEHRGGYPLANLHKLSTEFLEDTGLHLDLIVQNFGFPSIKAFIQSAAMTPYTHILENNEGDTIIKGKRFDSPLLDQLMNDQKLAGQAAKKKELKEQNEYATRIKLALRDPVVLKNKLMLLEVVQDLGGYQIAVEYAKVQSKFKEKFNIELNRKNSKEMFNVGHAKNMLADVFNDDLRIVESTDSTGMLYVKLYAPFEELKKKYEDLQRMQSELNDDEGKRLAIEEDKIDNPHRYRSKGKKGNKEVDFDVPEFMKPSDIIPMTINKSSGDVQDSPNGTSDTTVKQEKKKWKSDGKYSAPAEGQEYSDDDDEEEEEDEGEYYDQPDKEYIYKPKAETRIELDAGGDLDDAFENEESSVCIEEETTQHPEVEKTYIKETTTEVCFQTKRLSTASSAMSSPEILELPTDSSQSDLEIKKQEYEAQVSHSGINGATNLTERPHSSAAESIRSLDSRVTSGSTASDRRNDEYLVNGVGVRNKVAEYEIFMFIKGLVAGVYPNPMHADLVMEKLLQFMPQNPYVHDKEIMERVKKLPFLQVINNKFLLLVLPDPK